MGALSVTDEPEGVQFTALEVYVSFLSDLVFSQLKHVAVQLYCATDIRIDTGILVRYIEPCFIK